MSLQADGLAAFRGERLVLEGISFAVPAGEALLLLGPNGSGKSTLLRILAGLKRPDAGTLTWRGADLFGDPPAGVCYVGHLDAVKPGLSVTENLAFTARLSGASITEALAALELAHLADLPARMLSAGQKRRVALARLALSQAPIWLLDEPTIGLDTDAVALLGALLAGHLAVGGVIVAATHLPLPLTGAGELRLT